MCCISVVCIVCVASVWCVRCVLQQFIVYRVCCSGRLTLGEGALVDHGAPGTGQLVQVQPDGELIAGVGLQVPDQQLLFTPARTHSLSLH